MGCRRHKGKPHSSEKLTQPLSEWTIEAGVPPKTGKPDLRGNERDEGFWQMFYRRTHNFTIYSHNFLAFEMFVYALCTRDKWVRQGFEKSLKNVGKNVRQ